MTYFLPFLSVSWYVGFDCPYPNCAVIGQLGGVCGLDFGAMTYLLDVDGNHNLGNIGSNVTL